jgi:hypothetical protein
VAGHDPVRHDINSETYARALLCSFLLLRRGPVMRRRRQGALPRCRELAGAVRWAEAAASLRVRQDTLEFLKLTLAHVAPIRTATAGRHRGGADLPVPVRAGAADRHEVHGPQRHTFDEGRIPFFADARRARDPGLRVTGGAAPAGHSGALGLGGISRKSGWRECEQTDDGEAPHDTQTCVVRGGHGLPLR